MNFEVNLFLHIDKHNLFTTIPALLGVSKSVRRCITDRFAYIIDSLLMELKVTKLPKWCYLPLLLAPIYPSLSQRIEKESKFMFPKVPSCLNITNGMICGGSICRIAFQGSWMDTHDIDIFIPYSTTEPENKRVRVDLSREYVLDLIFKNDNISEFDISVCQIGIHIDTREVYVTPLFLYSYFKLVIVCRTSDKKTTYREEVTLIGEQYKNRDHISDLHSIHVKNAHKDDFCRCNVCIALVNNERCGTWDKALIFRWFDRVEKYKSRFLTFPLIFIK